MRRAPLPMTFQGLTSGELLRNGRDFLSPKFFKHVANDENVMLL
jgi:hypothetical protein